MIRFLIVCAAFFIAYLGFSALAVFDSKIFVTAYNYSVETTIFSFIAVLLILVLLIAFALKTIFFIFDIPSLINKKLAASRNKKVTFGLIKALSYLLINNKSKSVEEVRKFAGTIKPEHKELFELLQAETADNFDHKIQHYRMLKSSTDYNYLAMKRLAQTFYSQGLYEQAVEYASVAFNANEHDQEIIEILINCYGKLSLWTKFTFMVQKFSKLELENQGNIQSVIANYYLIAAKDMLESGQDADAIGYLESALEFNPVFTPALDLYYALNINLHKASDNLEIVEDAFIANPTFELAEIYIKASDLPAQEIYENLAKLVDQKQYYPVFMTIAAYLNLPAKLEYLRAARSSTLTAA